MKTTPPEIDLDAMLKRLHLPTVRRLWAELALRAESEGMSYRTYLEILCSEEIAHRAQTRLTRSVHRARFPSLRTIEEFDFTFQTSLRIEWRDACKLDAWISRPCGQSIRCWHRS